MWEQWIENRQKIKMSGVLSFWKDNIYKRLFDVTTYFFEDSDLNNFNNNSARVNIVHHRKNNWHLKKYTNKAGAGALM